MIDGMKEHKPVALWKGIVGTALSGTLILLLTPTYLIYLNYPGDKEQWLLLTLVVSIIVCIFSLIVSLSNLISTANYKRNAKADSSVISIKEENTIPSDNNEKTELLHKLLAEGKITIEEYDKLRNE